MIYNGYKPKIVFMGTPEFAVPTLEALFNNFNVVGVVTVPDKPQGRGLKLTPSAVKTKAIELGIEVLQPEKMRDEEFVHKLKSYEADIFVILAFRILPKEVYTLPYLASFNIHGSLLPKYRGAAPINWAIINGDKQSGLTSFILQEKVDTGNILLKRHFDIPDNFTAGDLHDSLMPIAAELTIETVKLIIANNYLALAQSESEASPAPKLFKNDCKINWNQDSEKLISFIHGVSPVPCAWTLWNEEPFKIYRARDSDRKINAGEFQIKDKQFLVGTNSNAISLIEIQQTGKKMMNIVDFLRGYRGDLIGTFH